MAFGHLFSMLFFNVLFPNAVLGFLLRMPSFTVVQIEEFETPRPHYRVQLTYQLVDVNASQGTTSGLIPDEINAVVHPPIAVGSDLRVIRQAAKDLAMASIERLTD